MIHSTEIFIEYFTDTRKRTINYVRVVPGDQINWSLSPLSRDIQGIG